MNEIQTYIQNQRAAGFSDEQITLSLANNGHSDEQIKQYFNPQQADGAVKLYSYWNMAGGAIIGGPLAITYMVQKNYEAWGELELVKQARQLGIWGTVGVLTVLYMIISFLPDDNDARFGFVMSIVTFAVAQQYQGQQLKEHKERGAEFIGFWKSLGVALIGMLAMVLVALPVFTVVYVTLSSLGLINW